MQKEKHISIGKITKTVGLKGYVKVLILTDFPERFKSLKSVKLFNERNDSVLINRFSNVEDFFIKDVIYERDFIKILFEEFDNIDLANSLTGCFLIVEESNRKKLDKDRYYYYELVDLDVRNNGEKIGKTVAIENYGGQDLFRIKLDSTGNEVFIPYVNDFVKKVDIENKYIDIEVIEGMLN